MEQPRKKMSVKKYKSNDNDEKTKDLNNTSESWQELTYVVLRTIFKHLSALDLSNASRVCRSWLEAANNEKRTRGPACLMCHIKSKTANLEKFKKETIECSMVKPSLSLFFTVGHGRSSSQRCHCDFLPSYCDSISVDTYGVVINNTENTEDDGNNLVSMFLPEVPNIQMSTLLYNVYDWKKSKLLCRKQLETAFTTASDNESFIKSCLMLFSDWSGRDIAFGLLKSLRRWRFQTKPCVWGGITRQLTVCNSMGNTRVCKINPNCVAVVLSGRKMQAFSILLDENCNTKERVETELKTFKERVRLRKHSMGFMFACCIRGAKMFDECNVESTIFKRLFPSVPLVGCFGDGEFAKNVIHETSTKTHIKWYNSGSSAFMILTYD